VIGGNKKPEEKTIEQQQQRRKEKAKKKAGAKLGQSIDSDTELTASYVGESDDAAPEVEDAADPALVSINAIHQKGNTKQSKVKRNKTNVKLIEEEQQSQNKKASNALLPTIGKSTNDNGKINTNPNPSKYSNNKNKNNLTYSDSNFSLLGLHGQTYNKEPQQHALSSQQYTNNKTTITGAKKERERKPKRKNQTQNKGGKTRNPGILGQNQGGGGGLGALIVTNSSKISVGKKKAY